MSNQDSFKLDMFTKTETANDSDVGPRATRPNKAPREVVWLGARGGVGAPTDDESFVHFKTGGRVTSDYKRTVRLIKLLGIAELRHRQLTTTFVPQLKSRNEILVFLKNVLADLTPDNLGMLFLDVRYRLCESFVSSWTAVENEELCRSLITRPIVETRTDQVVIVHTGTRLQTDCIERKMRVKHLAHTIKSWGLRVKVVKILIKE